MKTVNLGLIDIFPDFEKFHLEEFRNYLRKYGITVNFLFDEGIEFTFDESCVNWKHSPNNGGFFDIAGNLIFTVIDGFDGIIIENSYGETVFTIPSENGTNIIKLLDIV